MNRTIKILAMLLAVLALLLAGAGWWAAQSVAQEARRAEAARPAAAAPTHPVVVLAKALPAGVAITADVLKVEALPVRLEGGFSRPDTLLGRRAQQALPAGTPLLESHLVSGLALKVQPGERAVAVKVDEVVGIGHRVRPGDLVDVFVHFKREDREIAETGSRLLLPRLRVLAYGGQSLDQPAEAASAPAGAVQRDGSSAPAGHTGPSQGRKDQPRNAVLAVPVDQVATLLLGEHSGQLALALRHPEDPGRPSMTPLVGARAALPAAAAASSARADDRALAGITLSSMNGAPGRPPATATAAAARPADPRREPPRGQAPIATVEVIRGSKQEQVPL